MNDLADLCPFSGDLASRQIHLDFHTSPFIPDVGADFDPEEFARTMEEARVNSVTVFAKCHHGMSYYPTKHGKIHPHLKRPDLLGDTIEALHRRGIRAPIYTTVVWEENIADQYPEWRQMRSNGTFAQLAASANMQTVQPGRWRFNNFAHPDYQDYFEAHLEEILSQYDVDGFFIDILFFHGGACFSDASMIKRKRLGLTDDNKRSNILFESAMQLEFSERFTRFIRGRVAKATIFYNSSNKAWIDHNHGWAPRAMRETHYEIESLPSGFWGYFHFPRLARQAITWEGKPFLGMTGRFQKMWGDFGGLKPQAALEYECFRTQALGGGCSVGDQMYPGGTLDRGAYRMIGEVYRQIEAAEPFYERTHPCATGGILLAANPGMNETAAGQSEEGAVLMMEELHYDVAVLDDSSDLSNYDFLILPDSTPITPRLHAKLARYHEDGGSLLISHRAGFDEKGRWALDFLPIQPKQDEPLYPTYWRATRDFYPEYADDCRVIYQQGLQVPESSETTVLIQRILPYFKRSDLKFSSHFQTPPDLRAKPSVAAVAGDRFVYFADPVFREYRQAGNIFLRDIVRRALEKLGQAPLIGESLDPHIIAYPRRKDDDLHLTLLNYIPARKALAIDVIERALSFGDQRFKFAREVEKVEIWNGSSLARAQDGSFDLPAEARGRILLRLTGFFKTPFQKTMPA